MTTSGKNSDADGYDGAGAPGVSGATKVSAKERSRGDFTVTRTDEEGAGPS